MSEPTYVEPQTAIDRMLEHLLSPELNATLREAESEIQPALDTATHLEALGCDCPQLIDRLLGRDYVMA